MGHRFIYEKVTVDFLLGLDIAFCIKSKENVKTSFVNKPADFTNTKTKPSVDYRPRAQVAVGYKRVDLLLGYSLGLVNYKQPADTKAYSALFKLGIGYKLK